MEYDVTCLQLGRGVSLSQRFPLISVAPMMNYTDRHDRYILRLISKDVRLYTEMITTQALLRGDAQRFLAFHLDEKPVALQLGGSDPNQLARCAKMGEEAGYDEINLNVGCPSSRVSSGRFGACLMLEPRLVAECVAAMQNNVRIPVTVKCRIGVDEQDHQDFLYHFIDLVSVHCKTFIVHARKAWLSGLSPRENREIPPLQYGVVHQIKRDYPYLTIVINGGLQTLSDIQTQLQFVDGVMLGRVINTNPYLLADIQSTFFPEKQTLSRMEIIQKLIPYISNELKNQVKLPSMTRHLLSIFNGQRGANHWRRYLSENAHRKGAGIEVIEGALETMFR